MKQIIIILLSTVLIFSLLFIGFDLPAPKALYSSKIKESVEWRLKGGIPFNNELVKKKKFDISIKVTDKKSDVKEVRSYRTEENYEVINLKKQYLKWSE